MARKHKPAPKTWDATKEFKPFERAETDYHGHPRRRYGATEAKRRGISKRALHALRTARRNGQAPELTE